jgi:hypothetical protein
MNFLRSLFTVALVLLFASCAKPPVYHLNDIVRAGSRIEYYAQIHDGTWKPTLKVKELPRDMHIKEAEKWSISAAQQRLGGQWQETCIRVTPPEGKPVVVWQRHRSYSL